MGSCASEPHIPRNPPPPFKSRSDDVHCMDTWRVAFFNDLVNLLPSFVPIDLIGIIAGYSSASASDMLECKQWLLKQTFGRIHKSLVYSSVKGSVFSIDFTIQPCPPGLDYPNGFARGDCQSVEGGRFLERFGLRGRSCQCLHGCHGGFYMPGFFSHLCSHFYFAQKTLTQFLFDNGNTGLLNRVKIFTDETYYTGCKKSKIKLTHYWFVPIDESYKNILCLTLANWSMHFF